MTKNPSWTGADALESALDTAEEVGIGPGAEPPQVPPVHRTFVAVLGGGSTCPDGMPHAARYGPGPYIARDREGNPQCLRCDAILREVEPLTDLLDRTFVAPVSPRFGERLRIYRQRTVDLPRLEASLLDLADQIDEDAEGLEDELPCPWCGSRLPSCECPDRITALKLILRARVEAVVERLRGDGGQFVRGDALLIHLSGIFGPAGTETPAPMRHFAYGLVDSEGSPRVETEAAVFGERADALAEADSVNGGDDVPGYRVVELLWRDLGKLAGVPGGEQGQERREAVADRYADRDGRVEGVDR